MGIVHSTNNNDQNNKNQHEQDDQSTDNEDNENYVYLISQQTSTSELYEDGYNQLNTWGIFCNYSDASENANKLSSIHSNYNVFIHKLKCGFLDSMNLSNLDDCYPIEKWRNGQLINDQDISTGDNIIESWNLNQFVTEYLEVDPINLENPILDHDVQVIQ